MNTTGYFLANDIYNISQITTIVSKDNIRFPNVRTSSYISFNEICIPYDRSYGWFSTTSLVFASENSISGVPHNHTGIYPRLLGICMYIVKLHCNRVHLLCSTCYSRTNKTHIYSISLRWFLSIRFHMCEHQVIRF